MKLSIKLMIVLIIVHSSLSTLRSIYYTGLSPSWTEKSKCFCKCFFCNEWHLHSTKAPPPLLSRPPLSRFCMRQLNVCTSWHLNMWNVADYRAHSLVPSAAVRESAVSIRQAEGQRATFIYIPESHSNSLIHTVTNPKHQIYATDLTYPNATKGIKLSIQMENK